MHSGLLIHNTNKHLASAKLLLIPAFTSSTIRDFDFIFNVPLQEGIDWRRVGKTARLFHGIPRLKQFVWKILTKIISYVTMIVARCFVLSEIKVAIFI